MTQAEIIDHILADKDNSFKNPPANVPIEEYEEAFELAVQCGLIKDQTRKHYTVQPEEKEAKRLGGYEVWKQLTEESKKPHQNINIGGSVIGSQIGQDSFFRDLATSHKTSPTPSANEKQQNAKVSIVEKWVVPIIITVIGGAILLYLEHKTGLFSGK